MKTSRLNYDHGLGATSRLRPQNYLHPRWVQLAKVDNQALGELKDSGTNGIFVIAHDHCQSIPAAKQYDAF